MGYNKQKSSCRLYLITPPTINLETFKNELAAALDSGDVASVQLRLKNATKEEIVLAAETLAPIAHKRDVAFIMNDDPLLAAQTGCDGVHIGQNDEKYEKTREIVGPDAIIGVTCHNMRHLAIEAAAKGANYVAFGSFFPTKTKETNNQTKPEILEIWSTMTTVPCVAIGGITHENCPILIQAGANFLAVVSAIWEHKSGPGAAVKAFNEIISQNR